MRRLPASGTRVLPLLACGVLLASVAAAQTPPRDPDPTVVAVQVEQEGQPVTDQTILSLIETHAGQPLSMRDVRETITHLISLNRYEDAQPYSEPFQNGVRITWKLFPLHPVDRIEFTGMLGLSEGDLRRALNDRFSGVPTEGRANDAAEALRANYQRRGYPNARVTSRIVPTHNPDRATLIFEIQAGARAVISGLRMTQLDAEGRSNLVEIPDIKNGQPYDEEVIQRELQAWETRLRSRGYYEARATHGVQWAGDEAVLFVNLTRGPLVKIEFAGDSLPQNERDRLVPVKTEGSADEDLLEDSTRAIENYLHVRGYRDATAPFQRDERNGELIITFTVKRGPRYILRDLKFAGNTSVPAQQLDELVRLKNGEPFVRGTLDAGVQAIKNTYRSRGFTRADVKASDLVSLPENLNDPDRGVEVTLAITEGPRSVVRMVTFQGNTVVPEAELQRLTVISPGRAYVAAEMNGDRDRIVAEYRNRGHESAAVTSEPTFLQNDTQVDVHFTISEGPLIVVDHVIITGNRRTSTKTIERELLLHPGDPLSESKLVESRARLADLRLFRRAQIQAVAHGSEPRRDLLVQVDESPATVLGLGGGVEGGYQVRTSPTGLAEEHFEVAPRGFFQIGRRNLFGKNRTIDLFTRVSLRSRDELTPSDVTTPSPNTPVQRTYGFHEYRVVPTYTEPRLFGQRSNLQIQGILEQAIRTSFNFRRRELRAQADIPTSGAYHLTGVYSLQNTKLFDITDPEEKPLIDRLFPTVRLSKFSASIARETRDDPLDPSLGNLSVVTGDVAARAIGSEVGYVRLYLQTFHYRRLPVSRRAVLALGARVGLAHGFPRTQDGQEISDLPASERFFAGGETTVRGFTLDLLVNESTITPSGFPTGGNGVIVLNSEVRVALFGRFQAAAFLDAGNVFPRASDLHFTNLRPAPGVGMLYSSPFGPVRFDIGFNPHPMTFFPTVKERSWVLNVMLGQPF